ncbi:MAG TPA: P22 phage major capsid protein family protein [Rhizomicrobium sp.]|nr:P22 phage major capsid protein family protein [Rhizomicrobium sp.]
MSNTTLTASIIAAEAVSILDNELVMAKQVFRGYEDDFDKKVNGYNVGETITIRKPTDFTVRDGATAAAQDVTEGSLTMTLNKRKGVDFSFTSQDLTTKIGELSDRVIRPAMVQLANQIDTDLWALYKDIPNWVGTPGNTIDAFIDFAKGPERLDNGAVPSDGRSAVLSPTDTWAMLGSQTALYVQGANRDAYRNGELGMIGNVDTYMSQNAPTHTTGSDMSGTVGASVTTSTISYSDVKNSNQQTITTSSVNMNPGDVFTIGTAGGNGVYDVNPVTKAQLPYLKQFTVVSYSSNTLVFSPAIVWTGAFQSAAVVGVTDLNTLAITGVGTASTGYRQNLIFRKNAFALVTKPLVAPPGAVDVGRQSYKGLNVRVIPVYDGINDKSLWRLDVLYGVKTIDPRQAVRISGT